MEKLARKDLYSLEEYAGIRAEFRAKVLAHKQHRKLHIGENATLYFEDRLTLQYQVQEMLRIERVFEAKGIEEELAAYNPLIPDGSNLKATFMVEFPDIEERRRRLAELVGIEQGIWLQVGGFERITPIANEDLERSTDEKTSAVHFMRFEFSPEMIAAFCGGAKLSAGIDHDKYRHTVDPVPEPVAQALRADFAS
jgi:uncharacterized protein YggL (DUF469 family)